MSPVSPSNDLPAHLADLSPQTDISANNLMFEVGDDSVFTDFEQAELTSPSPRKQDADGRTIYVSRELGMPEELGAPVLCDFGSAVLGTETHVEDVQPNVYRAPEVIFEKPWSYSIDIWNVGCMVGHLFALFKLFLVRLLEGTR